MLDVLIRIVPSGILLRFGELSTTGMLLIRLIIIALAFSSTASADSLDSVASSDAGPKAAADGSARERFIKARSFCTYYGSGKVAQLRQFDAAILHPPMMTSANVARLSAAGVVTVGYITVGEDKNLHAGNGHGPGGKASWYFDRDGDEQPDQNPIWKSWYANANDPLWRASRVAEARRLVEEYGFHGLFLDVVSVSELYPESRPGMLQLIRDLREALPDAVIVMNQGFDLIAKAAPLVDGVMLESFTATYDFEDKKYVLHDPASLDFTLKRAKNILNPAIKNESVQVLVLDYALPTDREAIQFAANRAASMGYLFSVGPLMLDDVYSDVPHGEVNDKWLEYQSAPKMMAHKLITASNGFPAETVIIPSGCYSGYTIAPVVDPATDRSDYSWGKIAWASAEDGDSPWLAIELPEPRTGGSLSITWHDASGPSREFQIQVRDNCDGKWKDVASISSNTLRTTTHELPEVSYRQIRAIQPPGGGSVGRPKLMWITRIELLH